MPIRNQCSFFNERNRDREDKRMEKIKQFLIFDVSKTVRITLYKNGKYILIIKLHNAI